MVLGRAEAECGQITYEEQCQEEWRECVGRKGMWSSTGKKAAVWRQRPYEMQYEEDERQRVGKRC